MITKNDFNNGKAEGGTNAKYAYTKELTAGQTGSYPAITVLPDGTIATLTEVTAICILKDLIYIGLRMEWKV